MTGEDLSPPRRQVLLAAKGPGSTNRSRVWRNRGEVYRIEVRGGTILTVTSVAEWLESFGLLMEGPQRALGGVYLIPTVQGREMLQGIKEKEEA